MADRQTGIAPDIIAGLYGLLEHVFASSQGVSARYVTTGDGTTTVAGAPTPHKILENVNRRVPAFTISNTGSANIKVGYKGAANFTIAGGASLTLRWKNPSASGLVYDDQGNSGIVIEVIG